MRILTRFDRERARRINSKALLKEALLSKDREKVQRDAFEAWVANPYMLNRMEEPGYEDEYSHPWTSGAWEAWKYTTLN